MYKELVVVFIKSDGKVIKFFSTWRSLTDWGLTLLDGQSCLYDCVVARGLRRYWYLYKYPHIKIK